MSSQMLNYTFASQRQQISIIAPQRQRTLIIDAQPRSIVSRGVLAFCDPPPT